MESELYVGIKLVKAKPMTLGAFKEHTSLAVNSNLPDEAEGFLVEYPRSEPNSPLYTNYVSWSPKGVFEEAYSKTEGMTIAAALFLLSKGLKLTRTSWTDKAWVAVSCHETKEVAAENFWSPHNRKFAEENGGSAKVRPCYTALLSDGSVQMGWQPDLQDLRAEDWMIVS